MLLFRKKGGKTIMVRAETLFENPPSPPVFAIFNSGRFGIIYK